jgi:hypothetical protein
MAGTQSISAQPAISTSIYATGDALGGKLTFENAVGAGGAGVLHAVTLVDLDKELAEVDLVLFDQDFTASSDNAVFDPTDADLANCIGVIKVRSSDYASFNDNAVACVTGVGLAFEGSGGTRNLYGQLVVRGTPTYTAASDIRVRITVLQD